MLRRGSFASRLLALTLLGLVMVLGHRLVVAPVFTAFATTAEDIEQAQGLLGRYRALAAQRQDLETRLQAQTEADVGSTAYLRGENDALAAADLQERVRAIIDSAGGELRSTQILAAVEVEGPEAVRRVGLKLQFATAIDGLRRILFDLESSEPYLFVEELTVRERLSRVQRGRVSNNPEPMLDVSVDLYAYVRDQVG